MVGAAYPAGQVWALSCRCLGARQWGGQVGHCSLDLHAGRSVRGSHVRGSQAPEEWVVLGQEFQAHGYKIRGPGMCDECKDV